jgi:hypothetical protein
VGALGKWTPRKSKQRATGSKVRRHKQRSSLHARTVEQQKQPLLSNTPTNNGTMGLWGSVVGIATGYGLDDWGVGVRFPVGSSIFSKSSRPALGSTQPPIQWVPGALSPGGKAAGAWSWPPTSSQCRGLENVELYIHSLIRLHSVVLNSLSTIHKGTVWQNTEIF